jgi:hypothetical protein
VRTVEKPEPPRFFIPPEKIPAASVGSFIPLMAGVPSPKQAALMAATLATPAWTYSRGNKGIDKGK